MVIPLEYKKHFNKDEYYIEQKLDIIIEKDEEEYSNNHQHIFENDKNLKPPLLSIQLKSNKDNESVEIENNTINLFKQHHHQQQQQQYIKLDQHYDSIPTNSQIQQPQNILHTNAQFQYTHQIFNPHHEFIPNHYQQHQQFLQQQKQQKPQLQWVFQHHRNSSGGYDYSSIVPQIIINPKPSENDNDERHIIPSLTILILGFFVCFLWFINSKYISSKNKTARIFSMTSIILGVVSILVVSFFSVLFIFDFYLFSSKDWD